MSTAAAARTLRPSPFVRDVIASAAASITVMGSAVLVTGWLAGGLGPVAFGVYGLSRRLLSTVTAVAPGPLGVGLARAVAITSDQREQHAYLGAGTLLSLGPAIVLLLAAWAAPAALAGLVFSDRRYASVLQASAVLIAATSVLAVVLAWLRGTGRTRAANLWQVWTLGVGPVIIAAALARSGRLALIIVLTAAVTGSALAPLARWLLEAGRERVGWTEIRPGVKRLWQYALPRLPAGLAYAGIFALGPFLAPAFADLRHAGFLVAGQAVLRVVEGGTAGFGLVMLPKVAALQARRDVGPLRDRIEDVLGLTLHLGLFTTCQLGIWAPEIVAGWLGRSYDDAVPLIRIILVGVVPYLGYTMLRSIIDGLDERPINARNIYAAFAVTASLSLALGAAGLGAVGLAAAGTAGLVTLAVLSVRYLHRSMRVSGTRAAAGMGLLFNAAASGLALLAQRTLGDGLSPSVRLGAAAAVVVAALAANLALLRMARVRWILEIETRLLGVRES